MYVYVFIKQFYEQSKGERERDEMNPQPYDTFNH